MKLTSLNVHYRVGENIIELPTKMKFTQVDEEGKRAIQFEVQINEQHIQSEEHDSMEYAVMKLQKALPKVVNIACCLSCRHGNCNPYGDLEDEIFCLKDTVIASREDVVDFFSEEVDRSSRARNLLYYCNQYQPVNSNEKYTYTNWPEEEI
ncbi:hypothetical protein AB5N96_04415 [Chryseomicrobium imtechense]